MMYQTISFKKESTPPTEAHTELAIKNSLKVPTCERFHMRIWFPHRAGLIDKWWHWFRSQTSQNIGDGIVNCRHVALWCMVPESDEVHKQSEGLEDRPLPNDLFADRDLLSTNDVDISLKVQGLLTGYYSFMYMQSYEYARTLSELGYNVGFSHCVGYNPQKFNRRFGDHFNNMPVIPLLAVYAGTEGEVIQHTKHRDLVDELDVTGEMVGMENIPYPPYTHLDGDKAFVNVPYWTPTSTGLTPLTKDQARTLGVEKRNVSTREERR
jgi:hypothetical protein